VGLICIFIEPHILNEARGSGYIQAIITQEDIFKEKHVILVIKDEF